MIRLRWPWGRRSVGIGTPPADKLSEAEQRRWDELSRAGLKAAFSIHPCCGVPLSGGHRGTCESVMSGGSEFDTLWPEAKS